MSSGFSSRFIATSKTPGSYTSISLASGTSFSFSFPPPTQEAPETKEEPEKKHDRLKRWLKLHRTPDARR